MRKQRKVNMIRALKQEITFYKRQLVPVDVIERTTLKHMRLNVAFSPEEMAMMPKDVISDLFVNRMTKAFADCISSLPIETNYDATFGIYNAKLDLWVK